MRPALAAGRCAVVTAKTVAAKAGMIDDRYRQPRTDIMTGIAFGRGLDVTNVLTRCRDAIVTA